MKNRFIGREKELASLREDNWRGRAQLVVVYGRRQVGKTALVEESFRDDVLWKLEGIENGNTKTQLTYFSKQLSHCTKEERLLDANDWDEALKALEKGIVSFERRHKNKKLVVFFDEFQWLCQMKSGLVSIFKYHFDNFLSKHPSCLFVLCGSVSSFIVKKVIQSRALYGRVDLEINLKPLDILESHEFLSGTICGDQVLDVQMVLGGVPQYLLELNPRMSLIQNLNEYAFDPRGFFFKEFDRLFISHFSTNTIYEKILNVLSSGNKTPPELARRCSVSTGGGFTERVRDLELAGFIDRQVPLGKKRQSKIVRYRISDEFLQFHFRFIAPHYQDIITGNLKATRTLSSENYRQWRGYAFERLCQKHAGHIADFLRFSAVDYQAGPWFQRTEDQSGAQIDLMFIRGDGVLTVCELKYTYALKTASLIKAFEQKIETLGKPFPGRPIEKVLILGQSLKPSVKLSAYYDRIITAADLFGL
ncbi:MAG: AAA family ATPase [Proteobacteria bacterium]|nr:AAA family ATPase [Pseudomonadota bacterium]